MSLRAAHDFPGDIGAVIALLLNAVRLRPGEAIFLAAGNVHAYVHGLGVEIMANSDNVLRCGLTPKHVDVEEVLAVADFRVLDEPRWRPDVGPGREVFRVPVPDFELVVITVDGPVPLGGAGPRIVLCVSGAVSVDGLALAPGQAVFVAAGRVAELEGAGQAVCATVGRRWASGDDQ